MVLFGCTVHLYAPITVLMYQHKGSCCQTTFTVDLWSTSLSFPLLFLSSLRFSFFIHLSSATMCRLPVNIMATIIKMVHRPLPVHGDKRVTWADLHQDDLTKLMRVSKVCLTTLINMMSGWTLTS